MQFKCRAGALLEAITSASKALSRHPKKPIFDFTRVKTEDSSVRLTCTDGSLIISALCDAEVLSDGVATIPPSLLLHTLEAENPEQVVELQRDGSGVNYKGKNNASLLTYYADEEFPQPKAGERMGEIFLSESIINSLHVAGNPSSVLLHTSGISVRAADGNIFCTTRSELGTSYATVQGSGDVSCLIGLAYAKLAAKATKEDLFTIFKTRCEVHGEKATASFNFLEKKPLSPEKYAEFEASYSFRFPPEIKKALVLIQRYAGDGAPCRFTVTEDNQLSLKSLAGYNSLDMASIPVERIKGTGVFLENFSTDLFLGAYADLGDGSEVEFIQHPSVETAFWCRMRKGNINHIFMPMRV